MKTLEEILQFVRSERRVCPRPQKWAELFDLISGEPRAPRIPPPLIIAAWWHTSDEDKRERLALHIRFASDTGKLPQVAAFLLALPPDEWVSEGESG